VREALPPSPPLSVPKWVRESCRREMPPPVAKMPDVPGLVEKPFDSDAAENLGMAVVLIRSIPREAGDQHIYYRLAADALWRNGRMPTHVDLHEVALFRAEADAVILASRCTRPTANTEGGHGICRGYGKLVRLGTMTIFRTHRSFPQIVAGQPGAPRAASGGANNAGPLCSSFHVAEACDSAT